MILCTGSLNAMFTSLICISSSCTLRSLRGLKGKTSDQDRFINFALPLLCSQSSSRHLYSSIHLMSYLISSGGLFVNDSCSSESSGSPFLKVLAAIFLLPHQFHCKAPNTDWHNCEGFRRPSFLKRVMHPPIATLGCML